MKILHVIRDLSASSGGPVNALIGLVESQNKIGHEVKILTTNFGLNKNEITLKKNVIFVPCNWSKWRYSFQFKNNLKKLIRWTDVIHIHMIWEYPSLVTAVTARKFNKPFLLRPCGALEKRSLKISNLKKRLYLKFFSKALFNFPCKLHFASDDEKINSSTFGTTKSVVVNNGIVSNAKKKISKNIFYKKFPSLKKKKIILFLARIHPIKRPELAILSFYKIYKKFSDSVLVIAGPCEESYLLKLKKLINKHKLENRVIFTGLLKNDLLYSAYSVCDLYLLPSLQESFGISVVEAMAASKPVVISKNIAIANSIFKAGAGFVCDESVSSYSQAIEKLLSSNYLQEEMGKKAKKLQLNIFDWEILSKKLDSVYLDLINEF